MKNPRDAASALDDDEKGIASICTPGGTQETLIISESGLFTLILRCRDAVKQGTLPHRFRRWVTGEVLPAVRRTGQFRAMVAVPEKERPFPEALGLRIVREGRQVFGNRVAGQLWFAVGLPIVPAMRDAMGQRDLFWLPGRRDAHVTETRR